MGQPVVSVTESSTTAELHGTLREHQLHRMPVVDSHGRLVGIVSHSNLILAGARSTTAVKRTNAAKDLLETLSQIKTPRSAEPVVELTAVAAAPAQAAPTAAARTSAKTASTEKATAKKATATATASTSAKAKGTTATAKKSTAKKAPAKKTPAKKRSNRK